MKDELSYFLVFSVSRTKTLEKTVTKEDNYRKVFGKFFNSEGAVQTTVRLIQLNWTELKVGH